MSQQPDEIAERTRDVHAALETSDVEALRRAVAPLHAADLAELIGGLGAEERRAIIDGIRDSFDPDLLAYLEPDLRHQAIDVLGAHAAAAAIARLDNDDAVQVMEYLGDDYRLEILAVMPQAARADLEEGLAYPDESAGRIMRKRWVAVPSFWRVGDVIDYLRRGTHPPDDFYVLFVVDPRYRPIGWALLSRVMRSERPVPIESIMSRDPHTFTTDTDQEDVARIFRKYGLVEAPVVNGEGRLVGVITVDDVVDVIKEEDEEDFLRQGGVSEDDWQVPLFGTVRRRFPWLFVNVLTALCASAIVGMFEPAIAKLVTLAALMPIVASMGGNAGTQAATVTVRALATRQLTSANALRAVGKELLVGLSNGALLAAIMTGVIVLLHHNTALALVFGAALVINLLMAGLFGSLIPLLLHRLKADPAIASSVFLTAVTDMTGFFVFLGLAYCWLV